MIIFNIRWTWNTIKPRDLVTKGSDQESFSPPVLRYEFTGIQVTWLVNLLSIEFDFCCVLYCIFGLLLECILHMESLGSGVPALRGDSATPSLGAPIPDKWAQGFLGYVGDKWPGPRECRWIPCAHCAQHCLRKLYWPPFRGRKIEHTWISFYIAGKWGAARSGPNDW